MHNAERPTKSQEKKNELKKKEKKAGKKQYIRKEKSLEELSHKFLKALTSEKESLVCLDEMTNRLGIEKKSLRN
jgi:transcription factor E2F7/8